LERATPPRGERPRRKTKGRAKTTKRVVVEERVLAIDPPGSRFKGYEDVVVQELRLEARVIRYRRQRWLTRNGRILLAPLPAGTLGHFGPELRASCCCSIIRGRSRPSGSRRCWPVSA
jgi:hypothetical protein